MAVERKRIPAKMKDDAIVEALYGYESRKEADVTSWLEAAHTKEKQQFFRLLTVETINSLKEDR